MKGVTLRESSNDTTESRGSDKLCYMIPMRDFGCQSNNKNHNGLLRRVWQKHVCNYVDYTIQSPTCTYSIYIGCHISVKQQINCVQRCQEKTLFPNPRHSFKDTSSHHTEMKKLEFRKNCNRFFSPNVSPPEIWWFGVQETEVFVRSLVDWRTEVDCHHSSSFVHSVNLLSYPWGRDP